MSVQFKLSRRLEIIASHIEAATIFADIGSDHAYLPCSVCLNDLSVRAIAGEVQVGPYRNAIKTVEKLGLTDKVSVRFGDGLEVIDFNERIDAITISGMGGQLSIDILENDRNKLQTVNSIIIQPNTNAELVRKYLYETGFHLYDERILEENDMIYEVLAAKKDGCDPYTEDADFRRKQFYFGPFLMKEKALVFMKKWQLEHDHLERILAQIKQAKQKNIGRRQDLEKKMTWIEEDIL